MRAAPACSGRRPCTPYRRPMQSLIWAVPIWAKPASTSSAAGGSGRGRIRKPIELMGMEPDTSRNRLALQDVGAHSSKRYKFHAMHEINSCMAIVRVNPYSCRRAGPAAWLDVAARAGSMGATACRGGLLLVGAYCSRKGWSRRAACYRRS
ncbi:Uncharacterised protein [Bordetella pertussis]|nr:Uncharacterised protein [Bordetella pertussis]